MNTQSTKKTSGLKAGLKTLLIVSGTLLIPFYAIYLNTGVEDKKEILKSSKPVAKVIEIQKSKVEPIIVESKVKVKKTVLPEIINLDEETFDVVYKYHRDNFGEGSLFTWQGGEYVVDTYIEEIPASKYDELHFADAFKQAREDNGACSEFNWRGNKFSSCKYGETLESITTTNKENIDENPEEKVEDEEQILANK